MPPQPQPRSGAPVAIIAHCAFAPARAAVSFSPLAAARTQVQGVGNLKEAQGVASRCGIEDGDVVLHGLDQPVPPSPTHTHPTRTPRRPPPPILSGAGDAGGAGSANGVLDDLCKAGCLVNAWDGEANRLEEAGRFRVDLLCSGWRQARRPLGLRACALVPKPGRRGLPILASWSSRPTTGSTSCTRGPGALQSPWNRMARGHTAARLTMQERRGRPSTGTGRGPNF